jgi:septal ring factor EnvC (AmiA/AmiB activator)
MDAQSYNAALTELRTVRDRIKKSRAELTKLEADRDQRIARLAAHAKAKAERIAPRRSRRRPPPGP